MDFQQLANIDLIKELELDRLPEERRDEILSQMSEIIQQRMLLRIFETLTPEDKDTLGSMLDAKADQEQVIHFLQAKIPTLDQIALDEIGKYKKEMIDLVDQAIQ